MEQTWTEMFQVDFEVITLNENVRPSRENLH